MAQNIIDIRSSFKEIDLPALAQKQARIMLRGGHDYQRLAQTYAAERVSGSSALGVKTGRLQRAIKVDGPFTANNGQMMIRIYVDEKMTIAERDERNSSYAKFQEHGTGIHGPRGKEIYPAKFHWMKWPQARYAYRAHPRLRAHLIKWRLQRMPSGRMGRVDREYLQYALWVKGVKPKRYMQRARADTTIAQQMRREIDALMRSVLINLTGLSSELITGNPNTWQRLDRGGFPWISG